MSEKTVLIAAGGTGGHIIPALAFAEEFKRVSPDSEVVFVGVGRQMEAKLIDPAGYRRFSLPFTPLLGGGLRGKLRLLYSTPRALVAGMLMLRELKPAVVVGFGGYPSFIPMVSAFLLRIPTVLHEQNVKSGISNRALAFISRHVFTPRKPRGFSRMIKTEEIGVPVRKVFSQIPPYHINTSPDRKLRILVLGGSQGAVSVNTAMVNALAELTDLNLSVLHQAGAADCERTRQAYKAAGAVDVEVKPFIEDIAGALVGADLVISRAGASSVNEIATAGRAAIFVPLPIAGSHQRANAEALEAFGGALILDQVAGFEARLIQEIRELVTDPARIQKMAERARAFARGISSDSSGEAESASAAEIMAQRVIALLN